MSGATPLYLFFGLVVSSSFLIAWLGMLTWRIERLKDRVRSLEHKDPFPCNLKDRLVDAVDPLEKFIERHVLACVDCIDALERDPKKIDALRVSDNAKELFRSLLAPVGDFDEIPPAEQ